MGGRGAVPKDPATRRRRNIDPIPTTLLAEDDVSRGPDLPAGDWPERTLAWWETWRDSAQAATFLPTDWDFLQDTAMIHAAFVNGDLSVAAELRLRVAKFGATPEDRARLRMVVDPGPPREDAVPASDSSRSSRYDHLRSA